jgi:hypothetical protein
LVFFFFNKFCFSVGIFILLICRFSSLLSFLSRSFH